MTNLQRQRRLRQIHTRTKALQAELRALETEARPLENEQSWAMGYRVPIRGDALLAEMDRRDELARRVA